MVRTRTKTPQNDDKNWNNIISTKYFLAHLANVYRSFLRSCVQADFLLAHFFLRYMMHLNAFRGWNTNCTTTWSCIIQTHSFFLSSTLFTYLLYFMFTCCNFYQTNSIFTLSPQATAVTISGILSHRCMHAMISLLFNT